jgi:hypothetical protein
MQLLVIIRLDSGQIAGLNVLAGDYAVPFSHGGTLADLVPACARCNYSRGARLARGQKKNPRPALRRRRP